MKLSLNLPRTLFHRLRERYLALEAKVERLRERIPGLPRARVLLSIAGLVGIAIVLFGAFQVLLAPRQAFTEYTLPYVQNFDDVNLRRWFIHKGVWTIRDQTLAQTVGGDEVGELHMPFKLPVDQPYHASILITLKKDTRAAGLVFNSQYPNLTEQQQRVYLSHPQKDRLELVAGNTDESGSFIPQAQIPLDVNTQEYRLDVFVYETTYMVMLNGQKLIEKRPLIYHNGLVGFYSLGPAMFDTFKLTAADTPSPGNLVYTSDFDQENGGGGWVPFSGTWRITDKQMRQSDPVATDAGIAYETSSFQNYTLRATLYHTATAGAGVLFNMPSPYQLNSAQMVRFSDETDALVWGYYDDQGHFQRQGYAPVQPISQTTQTLQIFSGESSYDIVLNDQLLARSVPMSVTQGHVGLITSHAAANYVEVNVFPLFGSNAATESLQLKPAVSSPTPMTATLKATATPTLKPVQATQTAKASRPTPTSLPTEQPVDMATATLEPVFTLPPTLVPTRAGPAVITVTAIHTATLRPGIGKTPTPAPTLLKKTPAPGTHTAVITGTVIHTATIRPGISKTPTLSPTLASKTAQPGAGKTPTPPPTLVGKAVPPGGRATVITSTVIHTATLRPGGKTPTAAPTLTVNPDAANTHPKLPAATATPAPTDLPATAAPVDPGATTTATVKLVEGKTYQSDFTGQLADQGWRSLSGEWHFENGRMLQSNAAGADLSAIYTRTPFKRYSVSTTFAHDQNSGAGLIFNIPNKDRLAGAHMVRYSERRSNALIWGYYDADGRFQGQGYADVEPAGTDTHNLRVVVGDTSFAVYLDDKRIIDNLPLQNTGGYIGLLTTKSSASYDEVLVTSDKAPAKPTRKVVDAFGNVRSLNGNWTINNGVFTQSVQAVADYMVNLGEAGQVFTAEVRLTLPDPADPANANAGGGLIFHMSDRGSKRNAYVVRLRDDGAGIWWGSTDDSGRFQGQGSAPITSTSRKFNLKVIVVGNQITILLDNKQLAKDVTIDRSDGWIGLLAYGGPVVFDKIKIDIETGDSGGTAGV